MTGEIVSIHVAEASGISPTEIEQAQLVAGKGIVGDRNFHDNADPETQITLIEEELVARFNADTGLGIEAAQTGRNVVTRGISLNDLIGKEIKLGEVTIKGEELCDPCKTLGGRLSTPDVPAPAIVKALVDRGGLRASIVTDGVIKKGDSISI